MQDSNREPDFPVGPLTARESELLRKAGERVFALSRRLASKESEADKLQAETKSLRDLLAESREIRQVLAAQVASMQQELDREYEERSELRRLLASLHLQMQELLPLITRPAEAAARPALLPSTAEHEVASTRGSRQRRAAANTLSERLLNAARLDWRGFKGPRPGRR